MMHVGIAKPQWMGKRSRHSRRMRDPQFCVLTRDPWHTKHKKIHTVCIIPRMYFNEILVATASPPCYEMKRGHAQSAFYCIPLADHFTHRISSIWLKLGSIRSRTIWHLRVQCMLTMKNMCFASYIERISIARPNIYERISFKVHNALNDIPCRLSF